MESDNLRVRDAPSGGQGAKSGKSLYDSVRKLVTGDFLDGKLDKVPSTPALATYHNNALELVRANETILVLVKVLERLTESFALQALHHLGELAVCTFTLEKAH